MEIMEITAPCNAPNRLISAKSKERGLAILKIRFSVDRGT
jgi:hypothetical protein